MSNMTVNQRNQFERIDLSVPSTGVHVRDRRRIIATNIVAVAVVGLLGYATIERLDSWPRAIVFAGIVVAVIGAMIALSPNRRY
jgi:fatty acid desaturase